MAQRRQTPFPRARIVAAPRVDARVLHDLASPDEAGSSSRVLRTNFSLGQVNRIGEVDSIGSAWDFEQISMTQAVLGEKPAALLRMRSLARALGKSRFWLMFQISPETAPVWWHAYGKDWGELDLGNVYNKDGQEVPDQWQIATEITVDPFSYAERVELPARKVGNDPAGTSPASGRLLPEVRGDVPTRLRVTVTPSTTARTPSRWLIACVASDREAPVIRTSVGTNDGLTPGAGTSAGGGDSESVGGSSRSIVFTDGTARAPRLTGLLPAAGAPAGQYQVLARVSALSPSGGATISMQLHSGAGTPLGFVATAIFAEVTGDPRNWQWVPLGPVGIGDTFPDDVDPGLVKRTLSLWVGSSDFSASVRVDEFMFVPIAGRGVANTSWLLAETTGAAGSVGPSSDVPLVVDGDDEVAWLTGAQEGDYTVTLPGGSVEADPGADHNVLLALCLSTESVAGQLASGRATALAATAQVAWSYHPRSVWLGDGADPVTDIVTENV